MNVRATVAFAAAVLLALLAGTAWIAADWTRKRALVDLSESSRHVLTLVMESLRGELAKHQSTPFLIAHNPEIKRIVTGAASPEELTHASEDLARLARVTDASDIYLMNTEGRTVAASNYDQPRSFIGQNFNYRPYFIEAMKGRLGRYFALGTTSGERGYYFANPVFDGRYVVGVAVVKIQIGQTEEAWRAADHEIMVVDEDGIVFLSSEPSWVLRAISPISPVVRQKINAQRRYDKHALTPLAFVEHQQLAGIGELVGLPAPAAPTDPGVATSDSRMTRSVPQQYLMQEQSMPDAGWSVRILSRTTGVTRQVHEIIALLLVTFAALSLAAMAIYQRRRRLAERMLMQASANAELERRVAARTDELTRANQMLEAEVSERRRTEDELRETQFELVQASKLAALGQMSAGLSHELNQPLAAIRSYADNARKFLERQRYETASSNLASIVDLTDRMARIIRHLRTYARKEPTTVRPTYVKRAIDDALTLLQRRIEQSGASLTVDIADPSITAIAGEVRLQQVLVNLVTNALDAVATSPVKDITITLKESSDAVIISVADTGPGIADAHVSSVFDPFFTTKDVGEGLGLGLSITFGIVQQFGGEIRATNGERGGAAFDIILRPARSAADATAGTATAGTAAGTAT